MYELVYIFHTIQLCMTLKNRNVSSVLRVVALNQHKFLMGLSNFSSVWDLLAGCSTFPHQNQLYSGTKPMSILYFHVSPDVSSTRTLIVCSESLYPAWCFHLTFRSSHFPPPRASLGWYFHVCTQGFFNFKLLKSTIYFNLLWFSELPLQCVEQVYSCYSTCLKLKLSQKLFFSL